MTQPPYGYGSPPGYQPLPGYQPAPGYRQPPGYGTPQGYPPGPAPPYATPYGPPMPYQRPGYPPRPYPPRRRSSGAGLSALLGVLTVIVVVVGLLVSSAISADNENKRHRPSAYTPPTPSYTYTPPTSSTSSPSPTSSAAATTSRAAAPTTTKPAGPQPVAKTGDNPLFSDSDAGVVNAECSYPAWSATVEAATRFFQAAAACLDKKWRPALQGANLPYSSPAVSVPARGADAASPCGSGSANWAAFYCSANHTIYMPLDKIQIERYGNDTVVYLTVFAHEYGHHVQAISGITQAMSSQRSDAGARSALGLELSRRMELEAQCFAGMYVGTSVVDGAFDKAEQNRTTADQYGRGDKSGDARDHGTTQHYGAWFEQGQNYDRTFQCNTWNMSSDEVS
ncbi:neutral zinc metallopeptidase [Nocardia sp. CA-120079]|uniref:neutral zinc metallopeptidase n=1 Tax=Nocardia sp. CA-120079 TaxID=3239974 RepID=UPI003D9655F0